MAYKPTHKETSEYRKNDKIIKNIFNKINNEIKLLAKLTLTINRNRTQMEFGLIELEEDLHELLGTKRCIHFNEISMADQYEIFKYFKKLKEITLGE